MRQGGPRLILASASPARAALLAGVGLAFEAIPAAVDEAAIKAAAQEKGSGPAAAALLLATAKACHVAADRPEALVIGADQLLVCGDRWFDKPADLTAAADHLRALRGRAHLLVTATVCWWRGAEVWRHVAEPFLDAYLAAEGSALLGSVGAYRMEALGPQLFTRIEGEHSAILGLPLLPLLNCLRERGVVLE
jgi:septum formation protein